MAHLKKDDRTGAWYIRFYWDGHQHYRSCRTKQPSKAETIRGAVEQRIKLLKTGTITMPEDLTPPLQVQWILSGETVDSEASTNGKRFLILNS